MSNDGKRLAEGDLAAWSTLRLMTRQVDAELARRLSESTPLSMQDYDVLSSVAPRLDRRMPMKDLMLHLQWSYSRLSHHLARMESRGLVRRAAAEPGPGVDVVATDAGYGLIRAATGEHLRAVKQFFADALEPGEAEVLEKLGRRVLSRLPGPTPKRGW
ncbi:MarR family transcriptional regulator [Tessaracoccus sp. OS52]|uniref:MarR family winged helix-turn-helix transcriptional regulator n=1 Tax=Tessaracoccus sp. OS52 TaxID=2886691 RepID=UPI001D0F6A9D|nr:MarR family transcriptional regulator [Tessaracoccus sp. OS52]MCC2592411.1 MarR family transcriptional regulator [Tessaracoccus sp. OS52]